jgi:hypothetical protein
LFQRHDRPLSTTDSIAQASADHVVQRTLTCAQPDLKRLLLSTGCPQQALPFVITDLTNL